MIIEYHRPAEIAEAVALLKRPDPLTLPLGGGTVLSRAFRNDTRPVAVVDLQALPLKDIRKDGQNLIFGAAATLQQVTESLDVPPALRDALAVEMGLNLRQMATVAGTIVSCDGRSPFVTALLALDARLLWAGENGDQDESAAESLGDFLALRPTDPFTAPKRLVLGVRVLANIELRFESVGRAPLDRPVVCAAVGKWRSGRTRVALGGWGKAPILAMDGPEAVGAELAARSAYLNAGDEWASAQYRAETAARLAKRLSQ